MMARGGSKHAAGETPRWIVALTRMIRSSTLSLPEWVCTVHSRNHRNHSWVRVTGVLKMYAQKRHLNHITLHRLTDFNELWYHQLDVIVATLTFEKDASVRIEFSAMVLVLTSYVQGTTQGGGEGQYAGGGASAYAAQSGGGGYDEHANLTVTQKKIIDWINSHPDDPDDGSHIGTISRHVHATEQDFAYVYLMRTLQPIHSSSLAATPLRA